MKNINITPATAKYLSKHLDDMLDGHKITYRGMVYRANLYTMKVYAQTELAEIGGSINSYEVANITNDWEIVPV